MSNEIKLPDGVDDGMVVYLTQEDVAELLELYDAFDYMTYGAVLHGA